MVNKKNSVSQTIVIFDKIREWVGSGNNQWSLQKMLAIQQALSRHNNGKLSGGQKSCFKKRCTGNSLTNRGLLMPYCTAAVIHAKGVTINIASIRGN